MALPDKSVKVPRKFRKELLKEETPYHFAYMSTPGGQKRRSGKPYVMVTNHRVIYDASIRKHDLYEESNGSIPISKVSFVGTSFTETKKGCRKLKLHHLKISSGGGTLEILAPNESEAKELQKVIARVQSAATAE